jgi:hypothetical protein
MSNVYGGFQMKVQIVAAILLSVLMAQAEESAKNLAFSSKKDVEEEPGPEKLIVQRAQPELARFLETGVMSAQAKAALTILSQDKANEGKSLERIAIDALKENNK